jgi:predicted flavoprotein YhiN
MVKKLGHSVEDPLPSLFSFKIDDPKLHALAGVSSQKCTACLVIPPEFAKGPHKALVRAGATAQLSQTGPMLITHQGMPYPYIPCRSLSLICSVGLTGPAILRLSAFGAKVLSAMQYKFRIEVAWLPGATLDEVAAHLTSHKRSRALVGRGFPRLRAGDGITKEEVEEEEEEGGVVRRLWLYLLDKAKVPADKHWGELSAKDVREIARELTACSFSVTGRGVYRDEFVTCGGVSVRLLLLSS